MNNKKILAMLLVICIAAAMLTGCSSGKGITIGSKQYTENILMGEMYAQLIEAKTDITVNRKLNLGGTSVCIPAMEKGEIDLYFEYTGTAYNEILDLELAPGITSDDILNTCQTQLNDNYSFTMFDPVGLNNTYALAIKTSRVEELGVSKISDLAAISGDLSFGAGHTFYTRVHDGYDGIVATYGLNFKESLKMDTSLLYEAIDTGDLDVIVVFGTDSLLKKYDMTILEDDGGVFPPYHGAPLCRNEVLEQYPELKEILNSFAGAIDDTTMQELNYQVDVENRSVEEVAKEFLTQNGYI